MKKKSLQSVVFALSMILPLVGCTNVEPPLDINTKNTAKDDVRPDDPLDGAKYDAYKELDSVNANDYRETEQNQLLTFRKDAREKITSASSIDEINAAVKEFKDKIKNLKTDAEYKEYEKMHLDEDKENARKEIKDLVDANLSFYYDDEQSQIKEQQKNSNTKIFNASTTQEINNAVEEFKRLLEAMKKKADHDSENDGLNLLAMKTKYTKLVDEYHSNYKYSNANSEKLKDLKNSYKSKINLANSKADIIAIYNEFIAEANLILTQNQEATFDIVTWAEEQMAPYNPKYYREPEKSTVQAAWDMAYSFVHETNSIKCIQDATYDFLSKIGKGIKTDRQYYNQDLQREKQNAIASMNSKPNLNDYRSAEQDQIAALRKTYKNKIEDLKIPDGDLFGDALQDAYNDVLDAITALLVDYDTACNALKLKSAYESEEATALAAKRTSAENDIDSYKSTEIAALASDYKTQADAAKSKAKADIANAKFDDEFRKIQSTYESTIDKLILDDAALKQLKSDKDNAKNDVNNYKASDITALKTQANRDAVANKLSETIALIDNARTINEIATYVSSYKSFIDKIVNQDVIDYDAELLQNEKDRVLLEVNSYKTTEINNLEPKNKTDAIRALDTAIRNINNETDITLVASYIDIYKSAIDAIITQDAVDKAAIELERAKQDAITDVTNIYNDAVRGLNDVYSKQAYDEKELTIVNIEKATTITEVTTLKDAFEASMNGKVDRYNDEMKAKQLQDQITGAKNLIEKKITDIDYVDKYKKESTDGTNTLYTELIQRGKNLFDSATDGDDLKNKQDQFHFLANQEISLYYLNSSLWDIPGFSAFIFRDQVGYTTENTQNRQATDAAVAIAQTSLTAATTDIEVEAAKQTLKDTMQQLIAADAADEATNLQREVTNATELIAAHPENDYHGYSKVGDNITYARGSDAETIHNANVALQTILDSSTKTAIQVRNAIVEYNNTVQNITSLSQQAADALVDAKNDATTTLANVDVANYDGYDSTTQTCTAGSDAKTIEDAKQALITAMNAQNATAQSVRNAITAFENVVQNTQTAAQKQQAQQIADAKDAANTEIAKYNVSDYDGSDLTTLQSALSALQTVLNNPNSLALDITNATDTFKTAVASIKTTLNKKKDEASALLSTYNEASYDGYDSTTQTCTAGTDAETIKNAKDALQTAIDAPGATVTSIDSAMTTFNSAISGIEKLQDKINRAKSGLQNSAESVSNYDQFIHRNAADGSENAANRAALDSLIHSTQSQLDSATSQSDIDSILSQFEKQLKRLIAADNAQSLIAAVDITKYTGYTAPQDPSTDPTFDAGSDAENVHNAIVALQTIINDATKTEADINDAINTFNTAVSACTPNP